MWQHNDGPAQEIFDDRSMAAVSRIIAELPARHRSVIEMEYSRGRNQTQKWKARHMRPRIGERYYREILEDAHRIVDEKAPWRELHWAVGA